MVVTMLRLTGFAGLLAPALMLAGCDGSAPGNASAPTANAGAPSVGAGGIDPFEEKIGNLTEPLQKVTFFRAVRDAGFDCQTIAAVEDRGRIDGKKTWKVACEDEAEYVIMLEPGGVFKVSGAPNKGR